MDRDVQSPSSSAAATPAPFPFVDTPPAPKKRKYADIAGAPSPSPSEIALAPGSAVADDVVTANVQASASRPRLTISRGPVFHPAGEGSLAGYYTTDQVAVNRLGFRYYPAGLAEPGSKIPYRTIESRPAGYVRASWEDRSPFIKVTQDGLGLAGEKGYRSARLNVPVREGNWYLEVKVECGGGDRCDGNNGRKEGAHVRLGWGRREAPLNGPVGMDGYSYGYRDSGGEKLTLSRPRPYGTSFKSGDVVGMYISLPPRRKPRPTDSHDPAHLRRERIAIEFKGQEYFECIDYAPSKEMMALMEFSSKAKETASLPSTSKKSATVKSVPERSRNATNKPEETPMRPLPTLSGSCVAFFKNGESQGIAFQDLYDYLQLRTTPTSRKNQKRKLREGMREHKENNFDDGWLGYYPFMSLFNGARITINAGPDFEHPPPPDIDALLRGDPDFMDTKVKTWRPLCERYDEFMKEQWDLDIEEEAEAKREAEKAAQYALLHPEENKPPAKRERKKPAEPKKPRVKKVEDTASVKVEHKDIAQQQAAMMIDDRLAELVGESRSHRTAHSPAPTVASSIDHELLASVNDGSTSADETEQVVASFFDDALDSEQARGDSPGPEEELLAYTEGS